MLIFPEADEALGGSAPRVILPGLGPPAVGCCALERLARGMEVARDRHLDIAIARHGKALRLRLCTRGGLRLR